MNKLYDSSEVKEKFAMLLSKLHMANLLTDYINDTIVKSDFFDCFEKNDFETFMSLSIETIIENVFKEEVVFDYNKNYINEYYWAGLEYMDLLFNYGVPLKRALIIFPVIKMVDLYYPYHEAHSSKTCLYYLDIERNTPILNILRNEKNIQLSKLSLITNINEKTLRLFDSSNAALFATSLSQLTRLANFFEVDISVFNTRSSCVPYSELFFKNDVFVEIFKDEMLKYFGVKQKGNVKYISEDFDTKELRKEMKNYNLLVFLSKPYGLAKMQNNKMIQKYLSDIEYLFIYSNTIQIFKTKIDSLLF